MPAPTSYTEETLQEYMLAVTSKIATAIDWAAEDFAEAVNDTLIAYGVDGITDATNIGKLRSLARVEAWRAMVEATAGSYDSSTDSGHTAIYQKYQQLHLNAKSALDMATKDAAAKGYLPDETAANDVAYTITLGKLIHSDAYSIEQDDEEDDE